MMPNFQTDQYYLKPCDNPACDRQTSLISAHCCASCVHADKDGWDVHGQHSEGCDDRHAVRGPTR